MLGTHKPCGMASYSNTTRRALTRRLKERTNAGGPTLRAAGGESRTRRRRRLGRMGQSRGSGRLRQLRDVHAGRIAAPPALARPGAAELCRGQPKPAQPPAAGLTGKEDGGDDGCGAAHVLVQQLLHRIGDERGEAAAQAVPGHIHLRGAPAVDYLFQHRSPQRGPQLGKHGRHAGVHGGAKQRDGGCPVVAAARGGAGQALVERTPWPVGQP